MFSSLIVKNILSGITQGVKWVTDPQNQRIVLFLIIVALGFWVVQQRSSIKALEADVQIKENNINALVTTIEEYQTATGELVAQRGAFEGTISELSSLNEDLKRELQVEKNKEPEVIIVAEFISEPDTIENVPTTWRTIMEKRFELHWTHEESGEWGSRLIEGKNWFTVDDDMTLSNIRTDILQSVFRMNITAGLRESEDGFLEAFVRTGVPDVRFVNLQGARINQRSSSTISPKKWGLGFQVGGGATVDYNTGTMQLRPYVGIGISRNFIRW